jgi:hypothetical protein
MDFLGRDDADRLVELRWRGPAQALLRVRIPYLPVHVDPVDRDAAPFSVLALLHPGARSDNVGTFALATEFFQRLLVVRRTGIIGSSNLT